MCQNGTKQSFKIMKEYLIKVYSNNNTTIELVRECDLWNKIETYCRSGTKITIYEVIQLADLS